MSSLQEGSERSFIRTKTALEKLEKFSQAPCYLQPDTFAP